MSNNNNAEQVEPSPALKEEMGKFLQDVTMHMDKWQFTVQYKLSAELTEMMAFYIIECGENSTTFSLKKVMAGTENGTIKI